MRRGKLILAGAAAALILAAGGWYLGSPWWTLWRMREAARAGDVAALASYIDQPAVVARAKARARAMWGSVLTTPLADTGSARRFLALARRKLAELERERGDAPTELLDWFAGIPVRWGGLGAYRTRRSDPFIFRHGLDRFEVRERGAGLENGPVLSFRRHGLGWKLEDARWGQQ
jgi:hypothetical protein